MAFSDRYRINSPLVTGEAIDGEVVIIHLENGNYFSLLEAGEWIWLRLVAGEPLESIARELTTCYLCDEPQARQAIERLVAQLLAEELIVPTELADQGAEPPSPASLSMAPSERKPFVEPTLDKYTDMQGLLMVDPIHEVSEEGWPVRAGGDPDPGRSRS